MSSTHPSGEAQDSHDPPAGPVSPTARSTKAAPSGAIARPRAPRAVTAGWAPMAATPPNTSPHPLMDSASAAEPANGSLSTSSQRQVSRAIATLAAAASGACRPTAAEPTSSSRPASSSPRVCLTTMKIVSRTAKAAPHTLHRAARKAPTEVPFSRPRRNRSAGFALASLATASRLAAVGYSTLRSRAVMASSAAMPKT
ncbi:MAG TPA: hypothetical protein VGL33_04625, partial [Streptosporangiaceae bacterium]